MNNRKQISKRYVDSKYQQDMLKSITTSLDLPVNHQRVRTDIFESAVYSFELDKELSKKIEVLTKNEKTTASNIFLTVFKILLYRYTDREDIPIFVMTASEKKSEYKNSKADVKEMLPILSDFNDDPSFMELLKRINRAVSIDSEYKSDSFADIIEELQAVQKERKDYFFVPSFFIYYGKRAAPIKNRNYRFELGIETFETGESFSLSFLYDSTLFEKETIERASGHFLTLLYGIVENPEEKASRLSLLTQDEKNRILFEWNNTDTQYPKEKFVYQILEEQSLKTPDAIAVVFEEESITYRELNERSDILARYLRSLGVGPGSFVGICMEKSIEWIIGLIGILKTGGAYTPFDPEDPKERLSSLIRDTNIYILLTIKKYFGKLPEITRQVNILFLDERLPDKAVESYPPNIPKQNDPIFLCFTSGSTGMPKGILVEQKSRVGVSYWQSWQKHFNSSAKSCALFSTVTTDIFYETLISLCSGGTLYLASQKLISNIPKLASFIRDEEIERIFIFPSLFLLLFYYLEKSKKDLPSLKELIIWGEPLKITKEIKEFFRKNKDCILYNQYGTNEGGIISEFMLPSNVDLWDPLPHIGRPISNVKTYILDKHLNLLPVGIKGEIYASGEQIANGYFNNPRLTAKKFIPNPFDTGSHSRLYRTGDIGKWLPDGNIEFLGRNDFQVNIRGYRIEAEEIETILMSSPLVKECVVTAKEDKFGEQHLVSYIVPVRKRDDEERIDEKDYTTTLREYLKKKLPDYMIPPFFVFMNALPLLSNTKIDRKALPNPDISAMQREYESPQTDIEKELALIWEEVFGIDKIGINDNFIDIGGNSLKAIEITAKLSEKFEESPTITKLFELPTISEFAEYIETILLLKCPTSRQCEAEEGDI